MTPEEHQRMEFLQHSIESHDRQIAELVDGIAKLNASLTGHLEKVDDRMATLAEHMTALAQLSLDHERRLQNLEGGSRPS